jgi:hypothetical protein
VNDTTNTATPVGKQAPTKAYNNPNRGTMLFRNLRPGSRFRIVAEPTRGIRKSTDTAVYRKVCEAYSTSMDGKNKDIILYPNDVVQRV